MRSTFSTSISAAAWCCLPLPAQLATGTLVDGNVRVETTSLPMTASTSAGLFQNFRVAGATGVDHLYASGWYWRLDTDAREYAFHDGPSQGARTSIYGPDSVTHEWADVESRGFAARLTAHVASTGPAAGMWIQRLTFTNRTPNRISVNLFAYVDVDQCGAYGNDAARNPNGNRQKLTDIACATVGEAYAPGADHFQVTPYRVVADKLIDAVANNLDDTGLPLSRADYTAAWQWRDRAVAPGGSVSAYLVLSQGAVHSGCLGVAAASISGAGKAGSNGVPRLDASGLPFLGRVLALVVRNGYPGVPAYFVLGAVPANVSFPPLGTILVNPVGAILFFGATFDGSNFSSTPLPIPNAAVLCGATLHMQDFHVDPGAIGGIAHTPRLTLVLGGVP